MSYLTCIRLGTFGKTTHPVFCLLIWVAAEAFLPSNNPCVFSHRAIDKRGPRLVDWRRV
jgi:hypothetical protein